MNFGRRRWAGLGALVATVTMSVAMLPGGTAPAATTNLLSGDKAGFDAATTGDWSAVNGTVARVTKPTQAGRGALRVTASAAGNVAAASGGNPSSWTGVSGLTSYAGQAWVRTDRTRRTVQAVISFYDGAGGYLNSIFGSGVTDSSNQWVLTPAATGPAPANAAYAYMGALVYGATRGEVHYVDTASLVVTASPATYRAFSAYRDSIVAAPWLLGTDPTQPGGIAADAFAGTRPNASVLGIYDADLAEYLDGRRVQATESWTGRAHAAVGLFTNFDDATMAAFFDQRLPAVAARGGTPVISWMPWIGNTKGVDYDLQVANGSKDTYLRTWTGRLRSFLAGADGAWGTPDDRRVYLRFAHEGNGNWYPYSPGWGGTPTASFVAMWRHVHDAVMAEGLDAAHVQWIWSVNNVDNGSAAESLYPGDAYVDWVGIDGYNWGSSGHGPAGSPGEVLGPMLGRLRALTSKAVGVNEVGSTDIGVSVPAKNAWITAYFAWVKANDVRMTSWFNDVDAPNDFRVVGGAAGDTRLAVP